MEIMLINILLKDINDLSSNVVFLTKQVENRDEILDRYADIVENKTCENIDNR